MKRKVVLHGPSTLTVSLPSDWVKRHNIKKGTDLFVVAKEKQLLVSLNSKPEHESIILNNENLDKTFTRALIYSAYRKGFDSITLQYKDSSIYHVRTDTYHDVSTVIQKEADHLIGFEVTKVTDKSVHISNLTYDNDSDFNNIINRIIHSLADFSKNIIDSSMQKSFFSPESMVASHNSIEKLVNYALRLLNKKEAVPPKEERIMYHIISSIGLLSNQLKYFYRDGMKNKILDEKTETYCNEIKEYITLFNSFFLKYDHNTVMALAKKRKEIRTEIELLSNKVSLKDLLLISELKIFPEILYQLIEPIMELHHQV